MSAASAAQVRAARGSPPLGARLLMALAVAALLAAVAGGLLRAGVLAPGLVARPMLANALISHAALMICAFFGTVIGVERAVALHRPWAFLAPLLAGLGGIAALAGAVTAANWAFAGAAAAFVAVNIRVVLLQRADHTVLLLMAAISWLGGALVQLLDAGSPASIAWWFGFLVITIAAERLELTRMMPRRAGSRAMLVACNLGLLAGAALALVAARAGGVLYGLALASLAAWGLRYDIARRTIRTRGLSRYMAACLLAGYAWLGLGGLAWAADAAGLASVRDAALHSVGLGFVFDMVMAHALVILPAVAKVRLAYHPFFYLALGLMQVSLALRVAGLPLRDVLYRGGALGNALAIAVFVLCVLTAGILARRVRRRPPARG